MFSAATPGWAQSGANWIAVGGDREEAIEGIKATVQCELLAVALDTRAPETLGRIDEKCLAAELPWTSLRRSGLPK